VEEREAHVTRKLYDPQLDPERKVIADKTADLEANKWVKKIMRSGEQFLLTCPCGWFQVTSDFKALADWTQAHAKC
jgi:hypothetical protein